MDKNETDDLPGDFVVVRVSGPTDHDGTLFVVVCTRCDWQSGKGDRAYLLGKNGPARQHDRDRHASPPGGPDA